jgi:hypothetical protein
MGASWDEAGRHQRPLPDGVLKIIASGEREDPPPEAATNSQAFPLLARKAIAPFGQFLSDQNAPRTAWRPLGLAYRERGDKNRASAVTDNPQLVGFTRSGFSGFHERPVERHSCQRQASCQS